MKKVYIKPQAKAIALDASEILAGSNLGGGESNKNGGPTAAESKGMFDDEDWD